MKKLTCLMLLTTLCCQVNFTAADEKKVEKKKGPAVTDFNSQGFKIIKVVQFKKEKNALGKLLEQDTKYEIGRSAEMSKKLAPAEYGETYLIRWKYSGDKSFDLVRLKFEFKLKNRTEIQTMTREYSNLLPGRYRLTVRNTGSSFAQGGAIEYWRTIIEADDQAVAEKKSVLWETFHRKRRRAGEQAGEESSI